MDREKINFFKSELRNLRYYNRVIDEAKKERENAVYKLTGVKTSFGKVITSGTSNYSNTDHLYYWTEKEKEYTDIIKHHQKRVDYVFSVLNKLTQEQKKMILEVYVNNKRMSNIALNNFMDEKTLQRKIDKLMDNYVH